MDKNEYKKLALDIPYRPFGLPLQIHIYPGFVTGKIYTGKLKNACVPGLNCYSCPGQQEPVQLVPLQAVGWKLEL